LHVRPQSEGLDGTPDLYNQCRQGLSLYDKVEMYLAKDYIHLYESDAGTGSRYRIRLYLPYEGTDAAVVVCSDLPDTPGPSATGAAEQLAAEVISHFKLPSPPVWIEHRPPEATGEGEAFDLVTFADYEVRTTLRGGRLRKEIGPSSRKPLDRQTVETLVGGTI
jgi:hypothetical protein